MMKRINVFQLLKIVESDQLKILQAHVNGKNSGYM